MNATPDKPRRFTVEPTARDENGHPARYGIRLTPPPRERADGTTVRSFTFICLEAGEYLGDQENVLGIIADLLEEHFQ